jgi:hypothetical protein
MLRIWFLAFIGYVVIEGALRKWVFPSYGTLLFAVKDVLLAAALVWLLLFEQRALAHLRGLYRPLERTMWVTWILVVLLAFAVSGASLTSLVGLRYFLCALPLLAVFPAAYPTTRDVADWLGTFVLTAIPIGVLGIAQFMSPPDSPLNAYSWTTADVSDISTFGEVNEALYGRLFSFVRVTGTFSYISTYSAYLQFVFFAALGLFLVARTERRRLLFAGITALIFVNLLMNGSRAPLVTSILLALPFLKAWAAVLRRRFGAIFGIAIGAVLISAALASVTDIFDAVLQRNEVAADAPERISNAAFMPYFTLTETDLLGQGLGQSFLGLGEATAGETFSGYIFDEVRVDRVGSELGSLCYLVFLLVKIYWLVISAATFLGARDATVKTIALVSLSYQASLLWTIPIYNSVANIFYFLSIAMVCIMRREQAAALALPPMATAPPLAAGLRP